MLASISFPPNFLRTFSNSLPASLPLPGHFGRVPTNGGARLPLPHGNPKAALQTFPNTCSACHDFNQGSSRFTNELIISHRTGTEGFFKTAQLRSLLDKTGMDGLSTNSRARFGFMHDGRVDTLTRFLVDGFGLSVSNDQAIADVVALLLSFTGSDVITNPPTPSQDVPAATGRQVTFSSPAPAPLLDAMLNLALQTNSRVELVVRGKKHGRGRNWLLRRATQDFLSDRQGEIVPSLADVIAAAAAGNEFTATLVPRGTGVRLALDRDGDGYFDLTEIELGADPSDPGSHPNRILGISSTGTNVTLTWESVPGASYTVEWRATLPTESVSDWNRLVEPFVANATVTIYTDVAPAAERRRFYRVRMER